MKDGKILTYAIYILTINYCAKKYSSFYFILQINSSTPPTCRWPGITVTGDLYSLKTTCLHVHTMLLTLCIKHLFLYLSNCRWSSQRNMFRTHFVPRAGNHCYLNKQIHLYKYSSKFFSVMFFRKNVLQSTIVNLQLASQNNVLPGIELVDSLSGNGFSVSCGSSCGS